MPEELFGKTKGLAANQGLYDVFLAAGLIWSFFIGNVEWAFYIRIFFLACGIIVAALYGAFRSSKSILIKQGVSAIFSIIFVFIARCF